MRKTKKDKHSYIYTRRGRSRARKFITAEEEEEFSQIAFLIILTEPRFPPEVGALQIVYLLTCLST